MLREAIKHFADPDNCLRYVVAHRWPNGVTCRTRASANIHFIPTRRLWECNNKHTKKQFSVKVGTVIEDSPDRLDKWPATFWLIANCENGVSSYEVQREIGETQTTAWFMLQRIRLAFRAGSLEKLTGEVEADETFMGGLARNMYKEKPEHRISGTGGKDKVPVMGFLERGGTVRTEVIPNRKNKTLHGMVKGQVAADSALYTDALASCDGAVSGIVGKRLTFKQLIGKEQNPTVDLLN